MTTNSDSQLSPHQCGSAGALRCAQFAIDHATRRIEWHLRALDLPPDELLAELNELNLLLASAANALQPLLILANSLGKSANNARPEDMMFGFDGSTFPLDAMLAANAHDEEVCNWVRTARIGQTYCGCTRVS